jgi:cytoskeletal protein CcmA (bactofilin family)
MSGSPFKTTIIRSLIAPLAAVALLAVPAYADSDAGISYELAEGEINEGTLWLFSGTIRIDGEQDGNLWAFGQELEINGVVGGQVNAWAQEIKLDGEVKETARFYGQMIRVTGTVDGNLQAFGQSVEIAPGAVIMGSLKAGGADVTIEGSIDGDVEATGGLVELRGTVGGDVELEAETIEIDPAARIGGSLVYVSRKELELDDEGIVSGTIDWDPSGDKAKADIDIGFNWFYCLLTALIVGLAAVAIFSKQTPEIVARVGGDGLRSAGIGFITFVVVPVAGLLACVLIVTIPLVFIAGMVFGLLVYLAKVPVAIWIGDSILARLGRPQTSPYPGFLVGITVLYLVFLIPYLGSLAWWASLFVGLGAIVLYISDQRQQRRSPGGAAPIAPPAPPLPGATRSPTPQPS